MDKINILRILKDHVKTFYHVKSPESISWIQVFFFIVAPLCPAYLYVFKSNFVIKEEYVNIIIAGASILAGFLFNLLALFYSIKQNVLTKFSSDSIKIKIVNESISNTAFNIVTSILLLIFVIFCNNINSFLTKCFTFLSVYCGVVFILTLFVILKRMYIIIKSDQ